MGKSQRQEKAWHLGGNERQSMCLESPVSWRDGLASSLTTYALDHSVRPVGMEVHACVRRCDGELSLPVTVFILCSGRNSYIRLLLICILELENRRAEDLRDYSEWHFSRCALWTNYGIPEDEVRNLPF